MNNELLAAIDAACKQGNNVKIIRKQKHDPCSFYMTCTDGKQIGPIKCEGNPAELDRKFTEATERMNSLKSNQPRTKAA
jgi:hypothetical protein